MLLYLKGPTCTSRNGRVSTVFIDKRVFEARGITTCFAKCLDLLKEVIVLSVQILMLFLLLFMTLIDFATLAVFVI